jgi:hypothetical protein
MDNVDRFKKRKQIMRDSAAGNGMLIGPVDKSLVDQFLHSDADLESVDATEQVFAEKYDFEFNVEVSEAEVQELLAEVGKGFDKDKFDNLLCACRKDVLNAVVAPFGLGRIVSNFDKNGGNVDTINNAREGVYATDYEKGAYAGRGDYNTQEYHSHKKYIEKNRLDAGVQDQGNLTDGYTGDGMAPNSKRDLDHVMSAKEIHDDPGRVLADVYGPDVANMDSNLTSTDRAINRSKGSKEAKEFAAYLDGKKAERNSRINELKSKPNISDQERKELNKLEKLDSVDVKELIAKDDEARKKYNAVLFKEYYGSKKFLTNTAKTSAMEGGKMGTQQALGLVICEFFEATFDEVKDIYVNGYAAGYDDPRFFMVLKQRLSHISARIAARWKDACKAFAGGFISGFLSNLVTVVINMFVRTGKRMVRIIREGFFSLIRAIKLLCFPPEGMTFAEAAHEASKLIGTGLVIAGGVLLETAIDGLIKATPWLEPFADILTVVLVGALTGIASTFVVYGIDKMDLFKVNDKAKHEYVMGKLEANLERMIANGEAVIAEMAIV